MKRLILILTLFVVVNRAFGQEVRISFHLYAPGLADTNAVYIAGSLPQLGNWNPNRVKMEALGNQWWKIDIVADSAFSIEYKYTLGSWDREAANDKGLPLPNFSLTLNNGIIVRDTVQYWKNELLKKVNGQITGTIRYHRALKGEGIKERDIIVWLPPGYDPSSRKRYPVIYMQDGQNVFDPATSAFGVDWKVDETADSMIRMGSVDPVIIVGIYNTIDRNTEYIPTEKGRLYREFLANSLKPFIDSIYNTKPDRKHNFIGGSSAGGILAFMMVWEYPGIFSRAICMSPAFRLPGNAQSGWNYVSIVKEDRRRKKVFFYIDNGGIGLEKQLQPGIDEMLKALIDKGYKPGKDFIFLPDPKGNHNEETWSKRFPTALKLVTGRQ